MPETGEEIYSSFLGVPVQRMGDTLGVLVVQSKLARRFSGDEVSTLEIVAMVLAEMTELGAFIGEGDALAAPHTRPVTLHGSIAQEGMAEGQVLLHEPRVVITNPVADNPEFEMVRLHEALATLRGRVDDMLAVAGTRENPEQREVLEAYRMFANSSGWVRRMEDNIQSGLSAEASAEMEQNEARTRMARSPDAYLRDRLHDLDDLSNRLLRILTGQESAHESKIPDNPILVARNIGPGEFLEYGKNLKGVVLEEGSVGSHATIVARSMAIPLLIHVGRITTEALNGDPIIIDAEQGIAHLRPDETVVEAYKNKIAMQAQQHERYEELRRKPAKTRDQVTVRLMMNAGLMADLPNLMNSGAEGVGLFRTELRFLASYAVPRRSDLANEYSHVIESALGKPVAFRTLDIGSDKVLPYLKREDEPNPAMGWRALRIGLDRRGIMRMQVQALIRGARGRPLMVMFPLVADFEEFKTARNLVHAEVKREDALGHPIPEKLKIGAMMETPSLAYAPDRFFELTDFISIGGNDLKQFFFAADRENERVRSRYDTLNVSYLSFIRQIVGRCEKSKTPLSYCGEDAGRHVEAACLAAVGLRTLSMRSASIGRVKHFLRRINLRAISDSIDEAQAAGESSARPFVSKAIKAD